MVTTITTIPRRAAQGTREGALHRRKKCMAHCRDQQGLSAEPGTSRHRLYHLNLVLATEDLPEIDLVWSSYQYLRYQVGTHVSNEMASPEPTEP